MLCHGSNEKKTKFVLILEADGNSYQQSFERGGVCLCLSSVNKGGDLIKSHLL